ncbi:MAG: nitrogenase cofactor biosynthesis protein NifB [Bacteroidetes bacterium]|nr:nitrogenase cofactor biosynthesis protein NifB [Bacteroidota bacterium]
MDNNDTQKLHPCFDAEAKHKYARVHLPVAPKCNIQCNYCNRLYDCVNESRPGVTSSVLLPQQAVAYLRDLNGRLENLSVIGIAGPGDPFANPKETLETIRLAGREFPEKIFCLSTNGLNLIPYIDELAELRVSHVTITINFINPEIGAKIYSWVRKDQKVYRGIDAAKVLLEQQLKAIPLLKAKGITVKINTIILPGINEYHIEAVAEKVAALGADTMNCIPVYPNKDTIFADIEEPSKGLVAKVRKQISAYIKPMNHCARCRADAAGLLGQDYKEAFGMIQEYANSPITSEDRPYVAVATHEGMLVNQHLGEADALYIYKQTRNGFHFVEERKTPPSGSGDFRWINLARVLSDCQALLVSGVGPNPLDIIQNTGIRVIQMTGMIDEGLDAVFNGTPLKTVKKADLFRCGESCRGTASGCA